MTTKTFSGRILDHVHYSAEILRGRDLKVSHRYRRWPTLSLYLEEAKVLRHYNGLTDALYFEAGDLGLYPFGVSEHVNWKDATEAIHLNFSPSLLQTTPKKNTAPQVRRKPWFRDKYLKQAMLLLAQLGEKNTPSLREECDDVVRHIACHIAVHYLEAAPKDEVLLGKASLDPLIDQMHDHFAVENTVEGLGQHTGLSSRRFRSNFNAIIGISPYKYLTNSRIASAKFQVWTSQLTLTEIAHNAGFFDQSHFNRIFKIETGFSPGAYRRRHS